MLIPSTVRVSTRGWKLAAAYRERYTVEILDRADLAVVLDELPRAGAAALFCVEADPEACHRSIVADRLAMSYGVAVTHLRPARAQPCPEPS